MKIYIALILLILTAGCASAQRPKAAMQPAPEAAEEVQIAPEAAEGKKEKPTVEDIQLPKFERGIPQKPLPPSEAIDHKKVVNAEGSLSISAENMPLSDFVNYALGSLKVTYFIDEQIKNMKDPVTMRMAGELPAVRVFEMVMGVLEKKNLVIEEKAGALYIMKSRPTGQKPVDIRVGREAKDSPAEILQVVPLKYVRTTEVEALIRDFYKAGVILRTYPKENALLLSGQASAVKEVMSFIDTFDVPYVQGKKVFILKLTYWQTDEFIKQATQILDGIGFGIGKSSRDPGISFIPIKFLNSILVLAPDDASAKYILEWKERLDTPESAGTEEKAFIYTPKYSKASDLVDSLKRLYGATAPPAAPAAQPAQKPAQPAPAQAPASALADFKIAADDKRNIILISSSPAQYATILNYLESLDITPRQVLLEATIAELTLKDDLKYGLEWYIKNRMEEGNYTLKTLGQLGLNTATGLTYQFMADTQKFQAAINAFAQDNRINILSSPRLLVIDNQEATIQIGTDVPIITGETKSTSAEQLTTVSTQSVQYRSTGLIVKVKPTINTEGLLALDISLESSEAQQNTLSAVSSPIILTRRLNTSVVAATDQTIMLGGIMSENVSDTESKVPILGDIPLLGYLFKNTSKSKTKTELLIMIRPTITTSTDEVVRLTNEVKQGLKWLK